MANLKSIRADIATIKAEIRQTQISLPPVDDQVQRVRDHLTDLAAEARRRIIETSANVISANHNPADITPPPSALPIHAYGLAILAIGVDSLVAEAAAFAQTEDNGARRIPAHERRQNLEEMARKLYELELIEESLLGDAERRPDANAAAVLAIPLEIAIEADLLGVGGI